MREWKDYDDGLDYEDLRNLEREEKIGHRQEKKSHSRLNTTMYIIGGSIGRLLATATVVFAISTLIAVFTTKLPNTKGVIEFKINIDSIEDQAMQVVPGTEQTISTSITNDSAQQMYMFVRIDCGTYGDGDCIYSFSPDYESWSVVDAGEDGQIVLAWTEDGKLKKVDSQDSVGLSGTLTCVVPIQYFDGLSDEDMVVDFDGFGISTEESDNPKMAYTTNVVGRGK